MSEAAAKAAARAAIKVGMDAAYGKGIALYDQFAGAMEQAFWDSFVAAGGGGGGPSGPQDHAQSELTAATNVVGGPNLLPHPTDHEILNITRPDANTWQVVGAGLYEIKYAYDFALPSSSGVTCECRVLIGGAPIAQSLVQEGMHTVTGQDQIVHPGFLVTLAASDLITIDANQIIGAAVTWNITRGHFQIRQVG